MIQALFVDPKGPYPNLLGIDNCWGLERDALKFSGKGPCILHPPCGRWCGMAKLNERRWGAKVGDDGGCFEFALNTLRRCGGVLEHPAFSLAWNAFDLPRPKVGWSFDRGLWSCEVWQSAYGHPAHKRTWLLYNGEGKPVDLDWTRDRRRATHQVGGGIHTGNRNLPRLRVTHLTPVKFAEALIRLVTPPQQLDRNNDGYSRTR